LTSDPASTADRTIVIEVGDPLSDEVTVLVTALDEYLNDRCGPARNHGSPVTRLAERDVTVFVARRSGEAVGCAALQIEFDGSAEVKRMWVSPTHRGLGVGRQLLSRVEAEARRARVQVLRLETSHPLYEAIALYRAGGFHPCSAFGHYIEEPINLYFEKFLP